MASISIPLGGKSVKLKHQFIQLDMLELDQENPRIGLFKDNQPTNKKLTNDQVKFAIKAKSEESYSKLKEAIHYNKGIIQPVWLEQVASGKYLVVEGNTRVIIYQELTKQEPKESNWQTIYSVVLPKGIKEDEKNFVRLWAHLRGTNDWDAYEKAKYLYKLSEEDYWPITTIEKQTKLRKKVIEQNIEAFKIMQQQYLPDHADDPSEVTKFSYFVEYVKDNKLKAAMHARSFDVTDFCTWVGDKAKLPTGQNVRQLRQIFQDDAATKLFVEKGFEPALNLLAFKKPDLIDPLYRNIERVLEELQNMSVMRIEEIATEEEGGKEKMINELARWSANVSKMINDYKFDE